MDFTWCVVVDGVKVNMKVVVGWLVVKIDAQLTPFYSVFLKNRLLRIKIQLLDWTEGRGE